METVRVSSKGQIVIPKHLRTALHIEAGCDLEVSSEGDEIKLRPAAQRFAKTEIGAGVGMLAKEGRALPSEAELKQRIGTRLKQRNLPG
jgi:AbrB family looped-hinge helix DNA binding protein